MYKDFIKHDIFFCYNDAFLFFSMVSCIVFGGYDVFLFTGWFLVLFLAAMMTSCLQDGFSASNVFN